MTTAVDSLILKFVRRYSARDPDAVTELCLFPFLAIREGSRSISPPHAAVRDHFVKMIRAYRDAGYASFSPVAIDTCQLGEPAAFTTVRWHALDSNENGAPATLTTYCRSPAGPDACGSSAGD